MKNKPQTCPSVRRGATEISQMRTEKYALLPSVFTLCSSVVKKILLSLFLISATIAFSQNNNPQPSAENKEEVSKAHTMLEAVKTADRFINKLDSLYTIDLPVGIASRSDKEGENYAILVSALKVRNGQTFIDAYMAFTIPGCGKKIAFKGIDVPISFNGGLSGTAKLVLVSDFDIGITKDITMVLKGDGTTYVSFDCSGFRDMSISADICFNSNTFVPENEDGTTKDGQTLRTSFQTVITDWNNMLVKLSVDPFQFKPLKGVGFRITNAVMDMSDFANPVSAVFPEKYSTDYFIDGNPNIWRGFYVQEAEVRMPPQFKKRSGSNRLSFFVQNMLLDEMGFTGKIGVEKLMTLQEGAMGEWAFSVDKLAVDIQASQLVGGSFAGQLQVPLFKQEDIFNYTGQIGFGGNYAFSVSTTSSYNLSLWAAKLTIDPNSSITVAVQEKDFLPVLNLNGKLSVQAPVSKDDTTSQKLAIAEIPFQGMKIQTVEPYFSVQNISFGTQQNRFSKFPISISEIGIVNQTDRMGLKIGLTVNFVGEGDGGFGGNGVFTVWGKHEESKWKYDGVQIDKISVDISKKDAFELHGMVMFIRGDLTYGDGFKGQLQAKMAGFEMEAMALFGNVSGYRYWYADALLAIPTGIPCGPVSLYGFGGGAYYHMKQAMTGSGQSSEIGKSLSGIVYAPDELSGLGITASVKFGLSGNQNTLNGDVRFGISFTTSGGINQISFLGNAYFATNNFAVSTSGILDKAKSIVGKEGTPDIPKDAEASQLYGNISMLYDFPNKSFHSTFNIYVNVAGGVVKGVGPGGLAGWGVVHFEPSDWYIQLGTPDNPNGIEILKIAKMTNYFMAGKSIPELPAPPSEITDGLAAIGKSYQSSRSDGGSLGNGSGFALGAGLKFDTGDRTFLMFYGRFGCGIGFDILMKNYGKDAICEGETEPIGINGWYAQGQAYAWILANVGIKVDLPFYSGKYSIFDIYAAALMQAKAPNPFWMKGNVFGRYDILNGLVKGDCDFEFEIGEQCKISSANPLGGMTVIADIKPGDKESEVSVFSTPQVVFNMPVDKEFEFQDENKVNKKFRIKLRRFTVSTKSGQSPVGTVNWNDRHDVVVFKSKDILPGETDIMVVAIVSFEEYKSGGWFEVKKNGETAYELKTISFKTGKEPDYVPQDNVDYSYPGYRAFNYYSAESTNDYIKLKMGQPNLFVPGAEWKQVGRLTPVKGGQATIVSFSYAAEQINFNLPSQLTGNTIYKFEIVNIPASQAANLDANVSQKNQDVVQKSDANATQVSVQTQAAESSRVELQEKVVYSMEFRSSSYSTFAAKLGSLTYSEGISWELYPLVHSLTVNIRGERFDRYEVVNLDATKMISVDPMVAQSSWYSNKIAPITELDAASLSSISAQPFVAPALTSYFFQQDGTRILTDAEIASGASEDNIVTSGMKYYAAKYLCEYLYYLKNQVSNAKQDIRNSNPQYSKILNTNFPPLSYGSYPVNIKYTLPKQDKPNSTKGYNIIYND